MEISGVEVTNLVMIRRGGDVLAQRRTRSWQGVAFPGGHLEPGETLYDSAVREVREETGLEIRNLSFRGLVHWTNSDDGAQTLIFYYSASDFSGELKQCDEGENFWTPYDTLRTLDLSPGFDYQLGVFERPGTPELLVTYDNHGGPWKYKWAGDDGEKA